LIYINPMAHGRSLAWQVRNADADGPLVSDAYERFGCASYPGCA
jgi:hypothetical protein